jgi:peptidoglycan/xylan/chitin deacetylase (PgdA/CDA1 family)
MYHRVTELANDPYLMAVTPEHFAEHMEVVRKFYFPIGLEQLAQALRGGKIPKRAVVVTFDDGYVDNLYNARPILERYEIPAMVFVTTGHIGNPSEFWWDELDRLLLQPGTLPVVCELPLNGRTLHCQLDEAAAYTTADYERHRAWHIEREDDPTPRHRLHRLLYQLLHSLTQKDQRKLLDNLRAWASAGPTGRPTHRTLLPDELSQLADRRLIEIGAHTVTHPLLGKLPLAAQRDELRQSRTRIEELLDHQVISFAYPHGSYTQETLAVVQEAGFSIACSSDTDVIRKGSDTLRLPRMSMRNWDGTSFARWLSAWIG